MRSLAQDMQASMVLSNLSLDNPHYIGVFCLFEAEFSITAKISDGCTVSCLHGTCENKKCVCQQGFYGDDCSVEAIEIYGKEVGSSVNAHSQQYYRLANEDKNVNQLTVTFDAKDNSDLHCMLYISENRIPTPAHSDYVSTQGQEGSSGVVLQISDIHSGTWWFLVEAPEDVQCDFVLSMEFSSACSECNKHGTCMKGFFSNKCECEPGFRGSHCEEYVVSISEGVFTGHVEGLKGAYWHTVTYNSVNKLVARLHIVDGWCSLYARESYKPTMLFYDLSGEVESDEVRYIEVVPGDEPWYFGVFTVIGCDYILEIQIVDASICVEDCGKHGKCVNGMCECQDGFVGDRCDEAIVEVKDNKQISGSVLDRPAYYRFSSNGDVSNVFFQVVQPGKRPGAIALAVSSDGRLPRESNADAKTFGEDSTLHLVQRQQAPHSPTTYLVAVFPRKQVENIPVPFSLYVWHSAL
eukprot:CAMPEP_0177669198 /NCGR_PEP_ID=MMETSP0447-20121125/23288_1 /TAXON_ID=0 /ORGANISM="Stygamoeba regulata, Strain BSH-02190019" /LENGTH=465 /DNA_ID=CAMNT_0019175999 /DNA_START=283 /DNA_END=1680 /DNA_ORIENTATION=+